MTKVAQAERNRLMWRPGEFEVQSGGQPAATVGRAIADAVRSWEDKEHPRGPDGKFIRQPDDVIWDGADAGVRAADWDEDEHPRRPDGKFGDLPDGVKLAPDGPMIQVHADGEHKGSIYPANLLGGESNDWNSAPNGIGVSKTFKTQQEAVHHLVGPKDEPASEPEVDHGPPVPDIDLATKMGEEPADVQPLSGGVSALSVSLATYPDGSRAVAKQMTTPDEIDAEVLSAKVGKAIGAPVPDVIEAPGREDGMYGVWMTHIPGQVGFKLMMSDHVAAMEAQATPEGKRLGLLDVLVNNRDRNDGNWIASDSGVPVGIDHSLSSFESQRIDEFGNALPDGMAQMSSFALGVWTVGSGRWRKNDLTPEEVSQLRDGLQGLKSEFDDRDRGAWHAAMMARFESIAKHAKGAQQ